MKRVALVSCLLIAFLLPFGVFAQGQDPPIPASPPAGSYVLDNLGWLSSSQEQQIDLTVAKLDSENLAEIAVVTIDNCGDDKQKFRNDLFREWGIGHKERNDGLLIMVCWYGGDKSLRSLEQEVGYGLEGDIPDLLTSKVAQEYFVPAFKTGAPDSEVISSGKAGDALVAVVNVYDGIVRGDTPQKLQAESGGSSVNIWLIIIVVVVLVILLVLAILFGEELGGGGGYSSGGGGWGDSSSGGSSFGGGSSGGGGSSSGF